MSADDRRYIIRFGCPDRRGIVARISTFLADAGGWIVEAAYHTDQDTGWFFTRQEVLAESLPFDADELRTRFRGVAKELGAQADWRISDNGPAPPHGDPGVPGGPLPLRPARPGGVP